MMGQSLVRFSFRILGTVLVVGGSVFVTQTATADETAQIVVEARAPVQSTTDRNASHPGGARVDILSVDYNVGVADLDLTKHADVLQAQEQIKAAAKKACAAIQAEFPVRQMSDRRTCESEATARGLDDLNKLIAAAGKAK
jgi:UrcA family protein